MTKRKTTVLGITFFLSRGFGLDDDIGTAATLEVKETTDICSKMDFASLVGGRSGLGAGNL